MVSPGTGEVGLIGGNCETVHCHSIVFVLKEINALKTTTLIELAEIMLVLLNYRNRICKYDFCVPVWF